jgi:hypothetical protein
MISKETASRKVAKIAKKKIFGSEEVLVFTSKVISLRSWRLGEKKFFSCLTKSID